MNIKIICFTLILSLVPSIATPSTTQESILDALRADIPSYIVASKVDQLIREDPSCRTVNFLRFILQNYPSNKKMIFRIARRFNQLNCKEYADSLERILRQLGEQLSITQSVNKLLGSSNLTYKPLTPFVLQVQEGFYLKTGDLFRAALSPSKRYLSVGQMGENGSLTIWDLETGYLVSSRSEHFTLISTFINDRYLLVASQIGIKLWDVVENKQFILSLGMGIPTFLELSPDRKQLIINNLNGEVTIYEVLKSKRIAPFQLKRKHIVTELKAQVGQFIDHKTLLLGNDDGELFLYDIEQRKVLSSLSSIFLGELPIKKQDNFEFEIMRTLIVRQQIAISEDGQRYAVLINKQLALVERKDGKLNLIPTIAIREKSINSVMFTPEHLIVLTDTQLLYFAVDGELVQKFDLPPKLKKAKWMQKLDESSVVLIGEEFLSIYDLERRTVLSQHLAKINSPFKSNTRLIDANNLLFYTAKNGMRRVNFSKMPDAIKKNDVLFELLYRGSLANSKASERLFNLDKYQDIFYWIESPRPETKDEDRETYFYYLQPSSDPKKDSEIGFVKMPDLLNLEHLNKKADGFSKAIVPELSKFINNFNNLAFNGETVAFINNGKLKLLSVIDHKIRALSNLTDVVKLAFHPKNKQRLVIARQGGQIEIWDIRLQKRVQKLKLRLHQQQITRLSFDSSGQYLAILSTQHLDIWDISLNQIRFSKKVKGSGLLTLAFDSTRLIGTGGDLDGAGANLLVVDMKKMTAKTYHVDSHLGVWGDVTFGCDSNHFIETNFLSSELSLYEITKNGVEKRLGLLFLDDGEAVFYEPSSGRYWSTLEGAKYITFRSKNKISRIDQFKAKLSDHDLIRAILQCQAVVPKLSSPPEPPQVEILSPQISSLSSKTIKQTFLPFKLRIEGKQLVESITVMVNGTKRQTWKVNSKQKEIEVLVDSLQPGYNQISFIATDVDKNTSFPFGYTVYVEAESENLPNLYFLGIGANGKATEKRKSLKFPYKDAKRLASHFSTINRGKYWNQVDTEVLKPSEITKKGIDKALTRLSSKLTKDDLLIIYLSGHGIRKSGGPFFVTNKGDLSWEKIAKWLGEVKARTLVLLDACRAGDVTGTAVNSGELVAALPAKRGSGMLVFSAVRSWQETYEQGGNESGHSLFAEAISESFDKEVDINQDGVISLSEFYDFTTAKVEVLSRQLFNKGIEKIRKRDDSSKPRFDEVISYPHTPWLPNMELFGDIPLIPVVGDKSPTTNDL